MVKILITYAIPDEFVEINWPDATISYMCSGIGKVQTTYRLTETLNKESPDLVVNLGTAGTIMHQIGDIFICHHFIDRDIQKLPELNLEYEIDTFNRLSANGFFIDFDISGICNTGDSFLTDRLSIDGDVIDMEAYAQAVVCQNKKIPFIAIKYITDIIGQNSVKQWKDKLSAAHNGLYQFLTQNYKLIQRANNQ